MKQILVKGSTSQSIIVFIMDSTSTTGAGKTGLVYNTGSLTCYYVRPGSASAQLSLITQTVTGAWSSGGFVEIDATNLPGYYRLDLADAILASGVNSVAIGLKGATGMVPANIEIQLSTVDLNTPIIYGAFKKNVALSNFTFYLLLSATPTQRATGITPTCTIRKDGGQYVSCTNAATEVVAGEFIISLTQAEMNADIITLKISGTACLDRIITIKTES